MDYFFDFELRDFRRVPLYLPVRATAENVDDAGFVRAQVQAALEAASYEVRGGAGPWLEALDATGMIATRRNAFEEGRPRVELLYVVHAPQQSKRAILGPLYLTLMDPAHTTARHFDPIQIHL